jgi:hypothetical protein
MHLFILVRVTVAQEDLNYKIKITLISFSVLIGKRDKFSVFEVREIKII